LCAEQALEELAKEDLKTLSIFLRMYSFEKIRKVYCSRRERFPTEFIYKKPLQFLEVV
jgi:hypothetical protein